MKIDDVRELKRQFLSDLSRPRVGAQGVGLRSEALGKLDFAAGVSISSGDKSFRLALRLPSERYSRLPAVQKMREQTRGEIDVRVIGNVSAGQKTYAPGHGFDAAQRQRPLFLGASVGHPLVTAGTLGCFVEVEGLARPAILSNNHVLAATDRGSVGDTIVQPGPHDGGVGDKDGVATLRGFSPILTGAGIDVAYAEVDSDDSVGTNVVPNGPVLSPSMGEDDVEFVEKWGRTTGYTQGRVTAIELDGLDVEFDQDLIKFNGVIEIEGDANVNFSRPGDSGSVIYAAGTRRAYGLLFAGSNSGGAAGVGLTYAHPIQTALDAIGAKII